MTLLNKILAASFMAAIASSTAFAGSNSIPSSKSTAMTTDLTLVKATSAPANDEWTQLISSQMKTSNPADLFVDVSMECGLFTDTLVTSKNGKTQTSYAHAGVKVRVLVDGKEIMPGQVTFCQRKQTLSATFQGIIDGCLQTSATYSPDGNITGYTTTIDQNCTQPEDVELVLDTLNANAFNFIAPDVGVGVHDIVVQTKLEASTDYTSGDAKAYGFVNKASAVVDETNMVKDATVGQ